jgi:hypothetical protein
MGLHQVKAGPKNETQRMWWVRLTIEAAAKREQAYRDTISKLSRQQINAADAANRLRKAYREVHEDLYNPTRWEREANH